MDPWSKVDYSRLILEASMAMEKLPEVDPPSGRVPGQGLLAAPILKRQRRRKREGFWKNGFAPRVFRARGKYRPKGGQEVDQGVQAHPRRSPTLGRATRAPGPLVAPLRSPFGDLGSFWCTDFLYIFPGIYWAL